MDVEKVEVTQALKPCPLSIGDRVMVIADLLPMSYREDWRDVEATVAAIRYCPEMRGGYDITISEQWPPRCGGDWVDGFDVDSLAALEASPVKELVEALAKVAPVVCKNLCPYEGTGGEQNWPHDPVCQQITTLVSQYRGGKA